MALAKTLSDRMKEYESNTQNKLIKKMPVIIRLDGRSFSKFTKGFDKPFDVDLSEIFQKVALELRKEIENAKFIYSQSDEISILLTDWDKTKEDDGGRIDTWYDYRIQKIVSVASSIATLKFNEYVNDLCDEYKSIVTRCLGAISRKTNSLNRSFEITPLALVDYIDKNTDELMEEKIYADNKYHLLLKKLNTATFDARVFNIPQDEVVNYFIYRQQDAIRNSVSSFARKYYSTKQLTGINNPTKIEMVKKDFGIDFNEDISQLQKVGFTIITNLKAKETEKDKFELDINIPIFKDNREYIERYL